MPAISAVIITYNEEQNIARCIDSLQGMADEIIVVDSFSTDNTETICREKGVRFMQHVFEGHIAQKNYATQQASHEYVLSLDADEALSPELKASILEVKDNLDKDGYLMNRLANYCGKWIYHCGWYPDTKLRLFRKGTGKWGGTDPHDKYILPNGSQTEFLNGNLLHYTFYTVEEHRKQAENFSSIAAKALYERGVRSNILKIIFSPAAKFIRNYIILLGILDGYYGWLICTISAGATYKKYVKLRKIQSGQKA